MNKKEIVPLYKKLIVDLERLIENGELKQGDLLPSENTLCKTYHTTRATVRQALSELTNMGYIIRQQGKGSIVSKHRRGLGILSVGGVTTGVGDQNLKTVIVQKPSKQDWPLELFHDLSDEEQKKGCIFFSRLRYINNVPILFEKTFITNNLPRFTSRNLENRSFLKLLKEHYQVEIIGGEQKIWSIAVDKTKSKLLKLKVNSPIVYMERKLKTNIQGLNIYSMLFCNTKDHYLDDYF